jgi:hypothetical protein
MAKTSSENEPWKNTKTSICKNQKEEEIYIDHVSNRRLKPEQEILLVPEVKMMIHFNITVPSIPRSLLSDLAP